MREKEKMKLLAEVKKLACGMENYRLASFKFCIQIAMFERPAKTGAPTFGFLVQSDSYGETESEPYFLVETDYFRLRENRKTEVYRIAKEIDQWAEKVLAEMANAT